MNNITFIVAASGIVSFSISWYSYPILCLQDSNDCFRHVAANGSIAIGSVSLLILYLHKYIQGKKYGVPQDSVKVYTTDSVGLKVLKTFGFSLLTAAFFWLIGAIASSFVN